MATKFNCRTCCRFFTRKEFLDRHNETYHSDEVFQCPHCPKQIVSKLYLDRHVAWVHKVSISPTFFINCFVIQKLFMQLFSTFSLFLYLLTKMNLPKKQFIKFWWNWLQTAKTIQCEICSRMFKSPRCLRKHKLAFHEKTKPKICDICGLSLPLSSYRYHMANEHGEGKDFTCDKCNESFPYNFQLQRHICAASPNVTGTQYKKPPILKNIHNDKMVSLTFMSIFLYTKH